jgi:hypothetical protein
VTYPRVKIVGPEHPHRGEYGRFTSETISVIGQRMALVKLEHCQHGMDACYVSPGDIREVDDDDQFVPARETEKLMKSTTPRRWYCGMCERLFSKGGDCPRCGFKLERWPA